MKLKIVVLIHLGLCLSLFAQESEDGFARTHSQGGLIHRVHLRDRLSNVIDPRDEGARPYSPSQTCGKCHDVGTIHQGYHFGSRRDGRSGDNPGEPWILVDAKSGTQIPLSYRGWPGTYSPEVLGLSEREFAMEFGRQIPGLVVTTEMEQSTSRWALSGPLEVDCMICHDGGRQYDPTVWAEQLEGENFLWAPTAALHLAQVEGKVVSLKDDAPKDKWPKTQYDLSRFDVENKVFFDVVKKPDDRSCLHCHSVRPLGSSTSKMPHDGDVHLSKGLSCSDCHHHGLDHNIARGHREDVLSQTTASSCRECHLGELGGRFGAPKPEHAGMPPLHLESMSCTACHSGTWPRSNTGHVQTSMSHGLGLPSQTRSEDELPYVSDMVFARGEDGFIYPYREVWPAFWGRELGGVITPLPPELIKKDLRRALRVRRDFREELGQIDEKHSDETDPSLGELNEKRTHAFREKIKVALESFRDASPKDAIPHENTVYVSSGKVYRLSSDGDLEVQANEAVGSTRWTIAHDVRPARHSLGAQGCVECHSKESAFFYDEVKATGPAWDHEPTVTRGFERQGIDPSLFKGWELLIEGRSRFKWFGFAATGTLALILFVGLCVGIASLLGYRGRRNAEGGPTG